MLDLSSIDSLSGFTGCRLLINNHTGNVIDTVVLDPVISSEASKNILVYLSLPFKDDGALFTPVRQSPIDHGNGGSIGKFMLVVFGSLSDPLG